MLYNLSKLETWQYNRLLLIHDLAGAANAELKGLTMVLGVGDDAEQRLTNYIEDLQRKAKAKAPSVSLADVAPIAAYADLTTYQETFASTESSFAWSCSE